MTCRWLKPGGAILPDIASIHLAAAGPGATGLSFWQKVYGFDYSLVQQQLLEDAHKHALVKGVSQQDLLSSSCCVCQLDHVGDQLSFSTWVDQLGNDLSELQEASRPAMDEEQRNGIGAVRPQMHKVQVDGVHMQSVVVQGLVQDCFLCPPVIRVHPIVKQLLYTIVVGFSLKS